MGVRVRTPERKLRFRSKEILKAKKFLKKLFCFCSFPMRMSSEKMPAALWSRSCFAHRGLRVLVLRTSQVIKETQPL
jgi:hypothetical protein